MVRLVSELSCGATCWDLRRRKQPEQSMEINVDIKKKENLNNAASSCVLYPSLPAVSAAFGSGEGDLTGVDELEGKLLLV